MIAGLRRRAELARLLKDPSVRAVSVDVYDTLLLRGTQAELARFGIIARAQHAALTAACLPSPGAKALWRSRLRIHKAAYDAARALGGEVTMDRLAAALAADAGLPPAAIPLLVAAELAAEARMVRAHGELARLILAEARARPVVLASDMYLRGPQLGGILARHLPALAHLPLLVSSDLGASKRRGDLFAVVAERLNLPPHSILHVGDDIQVDVVNARQAGFRAFWYPRAGLWRAVHGLRKGLNRRMLRRRGLIGEGT